MPLWDWGAGRHVTGFEWFFVILAFLIDLGSYGQGRRVPISARGRLTLADDVVPAAALERV